MWDEKIKMYRREINRLRGELNKLNFSQTDGDIQAEGDVWQKFFDITNQLTNFEQALTKINQSTVEQINILRKQICDSLSQYNLISKNMHEFESLFMANVIRPGIILKQAKNQKKYLAAEYQRIRKSILTGSYETIYDLEADIQNILVHEREAFKPDNKNLEDDIEAEKKLMKLIAKTTTQDVEEVIDKDQLNHDFKLIVLPAVHPDTSDTPEDVFKTVFEVYQAQDFLLMEAYLAEYRGEEHTDDRQDILEEQERLSDTHRNYHRVSQGIEERLGTIKSNLTAQELDDPEKVREKLTNQYHEFRQLIQIETNQIVLLRGKIEGLVQLYIQLLKGSNHDQ